MVTLTVSQRRSCEILSVNRSSVRYNTKRTIDPLLAEIKKLALKYPRYGYRMIHAILRQRQIINHKRVYRLYTSIKLQLRRPVRKKKYLVSRRHEPIAQKPDHIWSMDFMHDRSMTGSFRTLNIVDNFSRECLQICIDKNLNSRDVILTLQNLVYEGRKPDKIICDNGPEFRANQFQKWAAEHKIDIEYIQPGKPTQNAFAESFNATMRYECFKANIFKDLTEAKTIISYWKDQYNNERPHSSIGKIPPAKYRQKILEEN